MPFQKGHKINVGRISKLRGKSRSLEVCKKISIGNKGKRKPKNEEWRLKISLALRGRKSPGKGMTGKKHSEEWKTWLSKKMTGNKYKLGKSSWNKGLVGYNSGEKNVNWKGGISKINKSFRQWFMQTFEYREWRKSVFERDDYTCQDCGQRGGELHADHIQPFALFPELRLNINNGRTLCIVCHKKTPTYGYRGKNCVAVAQEA